MDKNVYDYIISEEESFKTTRVPITSSKDWNMREHIERCTNVANGWFHKGKNDGLRPYDDIATPIIDVAFRSEGFDVKDIVPFVNEIGESHKSYLVKKFHPYWARKHELDTLIDEVVESSIIYDLALLKNNNNVRPDLVPLQQIAFCDQTDVLAGPICLKHQYSVSELLDFKGKWKSDKIDEVIILSRSEKTISSAQNRTVKTPGKYIEVYELIGDLPESWLKDGGDSNKYIPQMHIICYYTSENGERNGITLYKGKSKKINDVFKALKIDTIRSYGRACGRSVVERLFEPQVWANYSGIKLKQLLDSAISIFQTESLELANQKLTDIPENLILKHEPGKPLTKVDGNVQNLAAFMNYKTSMENSARILGSASDPQLGLNPVSGTPLGTTQTVVQQGQGIHEYRQGKIATFFADVLYRDWILNFLVEDMNKGQEFSEELSFDELQDIANKIARNYAEKDLKDKILRGERIDEGTRETLINLHMENFKSQGGRAFFRIVKDELKDIPMDVMVNIRGKQKDMAREADKLTNMITYIIANSDKIKSVPGIEKPINEMLENSGLSPIDFTKIVSPTSYYSPKPQDIQQQSVSAPPEQIVTK